MIGSLSSGCARLQNSYDEDLLYPENDDDISFVVEFKTGIA